MAIAKLIELTKSPILSINDTDIHHSPKSFPFLPIDIVQKRRYSYRSSHDAQNKSEESPASGTSSLDSVARERYHSTTANPSSGAPGA